MLVVSRQYPLDPDSVLRLRNWIDQLKLDSVHKHVLVNEKRNKDTLEALGVCNVHHQIDESLPALDGLRQRNAECILLYDTDPSSNEVCSRMKAVLEGSGVKVNTRFRKVLFTENSPGLTSLLTMIHLGFESTHQLGQSVSKSNL